MSFRTKLLSHKPQITEITLMGENYYLKSLSVGATPSVNRPRTKSEY